jgi:hypothetical protein
MAGFSNARQPAHWPPSQRPDSILEELRALREEMAQFRRLFAEWAGADLNGRFPYGKPTDQWGGRRR